MTAKFILTLFALPTLCAQFCTQLHAQGSLTPPAGPPAPVMKSLTEIYDKAATAEARIPVTAETCPSSADAVHVISQAGSYYLTGNVLGQSGKACIKLHAAGITLDLNGYSVWADVGSTNGIIVRSSGGPVVIKNGFVRLFPQNAINFMDFTNDFIIQDVTIIGSSGRGINALGRGTIERVTIKGAAGYGIFCEGDGQLVVRDCRVETVTGSAGAACAGIHATKALITGCSVAGVTATGGGETAGIYADNSSVSSCTVRGITHNGTNRVAGIRSADRVSDCSISGVTGNGAAGDSPLEAAGLFSCGNVTGCSVRTIRGNAGHEAWGIASGRMVSQCSVVDVSGTPDHGGIKAERVGECSVSYIRGGTGITGRNVTQSQAFDCRTGIILNEAADYGIASVNVAGLVKDNTVDKCSFLGIVISARGGVVSGNMINGNNDTGSYGIYAGGALFSRIEGNTVSRWSTGIEAPGTSILVVRNFAGGNTTNYNINASVPVVPMSAVGTNPNANISQ